MNKQTLWTDEYLDAKRLEGDPPADELVTYVYENGLVSNFNTLLRTVGDGSIAGFPNVKPYLDRYLAETGDLPAWFHIESFHRSQKFFAENEIPILACLLFASLPMSFAAAKGAEVLVHTHRMTANPYRRNLETIQMLRDTMRPDGIDPNGAGIQTLQKVRLLHAASRYLLLKGGWDVEHYGVPINQEDLAGTALLFSYIIAERIHYFGTLKMSKEQIADYIHMWKFFGSKMGIQLELLADTEAEAKYLSDKIKQRHHAPSEAGQLLTQSLLDLVQTYLPDVANLWADPALILRYFCGNEIGDILGVKKSPISYALPAFHGVATVLNRQTFLRPATLAMFHRMFDNMYETRFIEKIERRRASYSLPERLTRSWKMNSTTMFSEMVDDVLKNPENIKDLEDTIR